MLSIFHLFRIAALEIDILQIFLGSWLVPSNKIWKCRRKRLIRNNTLRKLRLQKKLLRKQKTTWRKWIQKLKISIIICNRQCKNSWQLSKLVSTPSTKPKERTKKAPRHPLKNKKQKLRIQMKNKLWKFKLTKMFRSTISKKCQNRKIKIWPKNLLSKVKINNNWAKIIKQISRNQLQICWLKLWLDSSHK